MKILTCFLSVFLLLGVISCTSPEKETVQYQTIFNEYRNGHGLDPLTFTDDLNRIAVMRLKEIKNDFSHDSLGHYNYLLAENIARGISNSSSALNGWDNSIYHRQNMQGNFKYTGYAFENGYAVQLFQ